ncbi:aromatic acid exporter family protein [Bacillus thermotolerans]|uniref:Integral membrane protein n=1 Tax=Bacillus thermotolerans TaxID=1221996 RepID=A0A0F5IBK8_BACTR|nr:aromatic acid exporter family protein [Bacillus thermotolerans]KKB42989.1 Integral membrane protein [Bacillus thermotolerans]KKB43896.1 Integral membrane protein [Bacillus thermotolerans]
MYRIGYRTIKSAVGMASAIMIAQWIGFDNFASAGIITLLCIQRTKKKSLWAAWSRFLACLIAIAFSFVFFEMIGYHAVTIGLLLLFFIPTLVTVGVKEGVITSSVIILHIFSAGEMTMDLVFNELGIITIGIIVALIMNLYMPSVERELYTFQRQIEEKFAGIFHEIALYLRDQNHLWDGKEIIETEKLLKEGKALAFRNVENHLLRDDTLFYHYFVMREKQFEIIERILGIVTSISYQVKAAHVLADFMDILSERVHPGNTAFVHLHKLYDLKKEIDQMGLPKTTEEFEARAALFQFIKEIEQYLVIKSSFKGLKADNNKEYRKKRSL